jgi:hypothetical protein
MMSFRQLVRFLALFTLTPNAAELAVAARSRLNPPTPEKIEACTRHLAHCSCPQACRLQIERLKWCCHGLAANRPERTTKASTSLCVLKTACGHKSSLPQATDSLKDFGSSGLKHSNLLFLSQGYAKFSSSVFG